jgi:type VI protein secretion system component Hcp
MKFLSVVAGVFALSAALAAQGPPAKGPSGKSAIAVTLGSLGCSTGLGTDAFEVQAWSWGASNPVDVIGGGGGSAGKVNVQDLSLTKAFDGCSPALLGAVSIGKGFPSLTLVASNKDGTTTSVVLSDVRVSSWQVGGTSASAAAVESASFAFSKVCLTDGSSGAKFCYDLKAAKTF